MSEVRTTSKYSALLYTFGGRVIQIAAGLGTLKVQTAYLSREEMGEYGLFINIATFLIFITIRPLLQYFSRRLNEWFKGRNLPRALKRVVLIEIALGAATIPIVAICATLYAIQTKAPLLSWAVVVGCWFFFYSLFNTVVPALNLLGYKLQWVIANSVGVAAGLAIAWLTVIVAPSALNWTLGLTLGFALGSAVAIIILLRLVRGPKPTEGVGDVAPLSFLIPATIAVGGIWVQFQALRLLSVDFMALGEYGLFTAGYGLAAGIMAAFEGLAGQYLQPYFYANLSPTVTAEDQSRHWSNFAGAMTVLTAGTLFVSAIYSSLICKILLSHTFAGAWPYFLIGILIESIRVISGSVSLGTHVTMQVQRSLRSYIVGVAALTLGMLAGKAFHSFAAFAGTLIAGCAIHLGIIIWDVCRHLDVGLALPASRELGGLFLGMIAYFACIALGFGLAAGIIMVGACGLYLMLMLKLNAQFISAQ